MLATVIAPTYVLSLILGGLINAGILAAIAGGVVGLVWFTFRRSDAREERVLRCVALVMGILLAGGIKAAGISITGLLGQSVATSLVISASVGVLAGWYLGRFLRHEDVRSQRVFVLVAAFIILTFADVYAGSLRASGFSYGTAILPNVAFLLAMGVYVITQFRPEWVVRAIEFQEGARTSRAEARKTDPRPDRSSGSLHDGGSSRALGSLVSHATSLSSRVFHNRKVPATNVPGKPVAGDRPAQEVGERLREAGLTLGVAESSTGGGLSKTLADAAGGQTWFRGGIVADSDEARRTQLGVPEQVLAAYGPASAETAQAMAAGVRERLGTDLGLAIIGVPGSRPGAGAEEPALGFVWLESLGATDGRFAIDTGRGHDPRGPMREALRLVLERVTPCAEARRTSSSQA
jgi:PncC family amidohydrolase